MVQSQPPTRRGDWSKLSATAAWVAALAAVGALILTAISQLIGVSESAHQSRVAQAALEADMQGRMQELDMRFASHPHVRPYFYENTPVPRRGNLRRTVLAYGEGIVDLAATIASSTDLMRAHNRKLWNRIMAGYMCGSPAVRFTWARFATSYSGATATILGLDSVRNPSTWRWQRRPSSCLSAGSSTKG